MSQVTKIYDKNKARVEYWKNKPIDSKVVIKDNFNENEYLDT